MTFDAQGQHLHRDLAAARGFWWFPYSAIFTNDFQDGMVLRFPSYFSKMTTISSFPNPDRERARSHKVLLTSSAQVPELRVADQEANLVTKAFFDRESRRSFTVEQAVYSVCHNAIYLIVELPPGKL